MSRNRYMAGRSMKPYNYNHFCTRAGIQMNLF